MIEIIEFQGVEMAVEETHDGRWNGEFSISVYSSKQGVPDRSDLLYQEKCRQGAAAIIAFHKIKSALEDGNFPWEVENDS